MKNKILQGNCLETIKTIPDDCIDAIVTDPPYELGFMGKSWDSTGIANNVELWRECLRVLKPGGYLLAFSGTRTYHRMASAIEDAGFEVRDMIEWVYGSGFPKSLNIGKVTDKFLKTGNASWNGTGDSSNGALGYSKLQHQQDYRPEDYSNRHQNKLEITEEQAKQWEGWGTALKPAHEPICMARKPLESKTVAENCLKWETGGINIDESRIGTEEKLGRPIGAGDKEGKIYGKYNAPAGTRYGDELTGRFPANLIHDNSDVVRDCFPNESERFFKSIVYTAKASKSERNSGLDCYLTVKYNGSIIDNDKTLCKEENMVAVQLLKKVISEQELVSFNIDESGVNIMAQCHQDSLSTILTETKRIIGLKIYNLLMHSLTNESTQVANLETEVGGNLVENVAYLKRWILTTTKGNQELALGASRVVCEMLSLISVKENWRKKTNIHSTVKPVALMEYLVKMVSREGAIILDPFAGSGSTLIACKRNNRLYIGCELDAEYIKISEARLAAIVVGKQTALL